jgi:hypothetical protein
VQVKTAVNLLPLSEHSDHDRACCGLDAVAIDLGCVKTSAREERAELFSQLSSPGSLRRRLRFSN